ncbi:MAG: LemA family protein [Opitutales bacterium]
MPTELVILLIALALPLFWVVMVFNRFVSLRNHIRESWSNIDTELKRRYDLIPNLVEVVRGYARHEREVLEQVAALRNQCAQNHGAVASQAADEKQLVAAVSKLLALAEAYPELKAQESFLKLQRELINTEDRIQAARRFFNGNVRDYRNRFQMFPSNIVASLFNFAPESYFDVDPSVREVPSTRF